MENLEKKYPYKKNFQKDFFSPVRSACLFVVKALTKLVEEMNNNVFFDFDQDGLILRAINKEYLSNAKQRLQYWKEQTKIGILIDNIDKDDYKKFIDNELQGLWKKEKAFINVISYDKFLGACEYLEKKGYKEPLKEYHQIQNDNRNFSLLMCSKHKFDEIKSQISEMLKQYRNDATGVVKKKQSAPSQQNQANQQQNRNIQNKSQSVVQKPLTWDDKIHYIQEQITQKSKKFTFSIKIFTWFLFSGLVQNKQFSKLQFLQKQNQIEIKIKENEDFNDEMSQMFYELFIMKEKIQMSVIYQECSYLIYDRIRESNNFRIFQAQNTDYIDLFHHQSFKTTCLDIEDYELRKIICDFYVEKIQNKKEFCYLVAPKERFELYQLRINQQIIIQEKENYSYQNILKTLQNFNEFSIPVHLLELDLTQIEGKLQSLKIIQITGIAYKTIISRVKFCVKIAKITNSYELKRNIQNLNLITQYQNPQFIQYFGSVLKDNKGEENYCEIYMFFELKQKNLYQAIKEGICITPRMQIKLVTGIVTGINFIHNGSQKPMSHGNIKPQNILLDEFNNIFITDPTKEPLIDKHPYIAPELLNQKYSSQQGDIWSIGLIFYFIVTGQLITTQDYLKIYNIKLDEAIKSSHSKLMSEIFILIQDTLQVELDFRLNSTEEFLKRLEDLQNFFY